MNLSRVAQVLLAVSLVSQAPAAFGQKEKFRSAPEWRFEFTHGGVGIVDPSKGVYFQRRSGKRPELVRRGLVTAFDSTAMSGKTPGSGSATTGGTRTFSYEGQPVRMWGAKGGFVMFFEMKSGVYALFQNGRLRKIAAAESLIGSGTDSDYHRTEAFELGGRSYRGIGFRMKDGQGSRPTLIGIRDDGWMVQSQAILGEGVKLEGYALDGALGAAGKPVIQFSIQSDRGTVRESLFAQDWTSATGFENFEKNGGRSQAYLRLSQLVNFRPLEPAAGRLSPDPAAGKIVDQLIRESRNIALPWTAVVEEARIPALVAAAESRVSPDTFAGVFEFVLPPSESYTPASEKMLVEEILGEIGEVQRTVRKHGILIVVRTPTRAYLSYLPKGSQAVVPSMISPCRLEFLTDGPVIEVRSQADVF